MWRRARRLSCLGHMFLERRRPRLNASRYWGDNLYDQFDRYSPDARRPRGPARGAPPRSDRPRGPHCRLSRTPRIWRSAIMRPRRTVSMDIRYWGGNLRIGPNGGRVCRACNAANQRAPSRLRNPLTRIAHILRYVNYYATCPLPRGHSCCRAQPAVRPAAKGHDHALSGAAGEPAGEHRNRRPWPV
jgi:hypothetical protein